MAAKKKSTKKKKKILLTEISPEYLHEDYAVWLEDLTELANLEKEEGECNEEETAARETLEEIESGLIRLPGEQVFEDLLEPSRFENNEHRTFSVTFRVPKESESAKQLFATCDTIARKTWKEEQEQIDKLDRIFGAIAQGIRPKDCPISIQDGDLSEYDRDEGCWVVKASCKEDTESESEGRPHIYDEVGQPIYAGGELVDEEVLPPKFGDRCWYLIRVWCMTRKGADDRINFSLEGIQIVQRWSAGTGARRVSAEKALEILSRGGNEDAFSQLPAYATPADAGEDDEEEDEDEEQEKPVKAKKSSAKKSVKKGSSATPAASKKSVFKRGKSKK